MQGVITGMTLKEMVGAARAEVGKGEEADRAVLAELLGKMEQQVVRDQAATARLEKRSLAVGDRSPEEVAKLFSDFEELKLSSEELRSASEAKDRKLESFAKERASSEKALSEALSGERSAVARLVLDTGLTSELMKANVKPSLIPAAKALIREKGILSIESEGDVRRAVATLKADGKESRMDLGAYVAQFAASDEGKEFVQAAANSGSGSGGASDAREARGAGEPSGKTMREGAFAALAPKEKARFIAEKGTVLG
jgi:hypothetical protein